MQIINITVDEQGMIKVASPFDVPTTLIALLEAQKVVLIQTFQQPPAPVPAPEDPSNIPTEDPNQLTTDELLKPGGI